MTFSPNFLSVEPCCMYFCVCVVACPSLPLQSSLSVAATLGAAIQSGKGMQESFLALKSQLIES